STPGTLRVSATLRPLTLHHSARRCSPTRRSSDLDSEPDDSHSARLGFLLHRSGADWRGTWGYLSRHAGRKFRSGRCGPHGGINRDRKSTRLNFSHGSTSYAVFSLTTYKSTAQPAH